VIPAIGGRDDRIRIQGQPLAKTKLGGKLGGGERKERKGKGKGGKRRERLKELQLKQKQNWRYQW
jgi:hypothetical protein